MGPCLSCRETEGKTKARTIEEIIRNTCRERGDSMADEVLEKLAGLCVQSADFHTADA